MQGRKFIRKFRYRDIFDGNRHELKREVDYFGSEKRLRHSIYVSAIRRGYRAEVVCFDNSIFVIVKPRNI